MQEEQTSYRNILKVTSLFGGIQFLTMIIAVIRSKFIAVLLGPTGMGIVGLLTNTIGLIGGFTNLGLETSAIKNISQANNNTSILETEVSTLKRLIWFTGILGMFITILFSSWLSEIVFSNTDYTYIFIWISISLLFKQLTAGHLAVLQGLRRLKLLAKANLFGSIFGLIFTIPLYYFYRIDAIAPVIVLSSIIGLACSWFFLREIELKPVQLSSREVLRNGKGMIQLGFSLSIIGLLTLLTSYVLQIIISKNGGVDQVGLYNAGFTIINTYVGMIFTAISVDYFPRLASIVSDNFALKTTVIQQAIVSLLIITPIIICFLTFAPFIINILYSKKFVGVVPMVTWAILGMLFKAVSFTMGYILIAKEDSKLFIKTSISFNLLFLLNNYFAYLYFGLEGLGISFLVNFIIHFFALKIISYYCYDFTFNKEFYKIFTISVILCTITFLFSYISLSYVKYAAMILMLVISLLFALFSLDKKIDLKQMLNSRFKNRYNGK